MPTHPTEVMSRSAPLHPNGCYHAELPASFSPIYANCQIADDPHKIRLIELLPGTAFQPIVCNLQSVSLDSPSRPQYTALSYVWGDSTFLQPIAVNGQLLGITRNLHTALYYLRDPVLSRMLWVDAICINQSDTRERNHQVGLMRSVYRGAQDVVAWLGEATDGSDLAMDYLASGTWLSSPVVTASEDLLQILGRLCSRPYWSRVWVVQELAMASQITFHCGYKSLHWEVLAEFLKKRFDFKHPTRTSFRQPRSLLRLARGEQKELLVTLREAAEFETSIPADKVYGLLGLFPQAIQDILVPDYAKSFPSLLYELLQAYISVAKDVEFLCAFPRLTDSRPSTPCPSWLPDIRERVGGLGEWYNPAGRPWDTVVSLHKGILTVPGVLVGRLGSTLGPFETKKDVLVENFFRHGRMLLGGASFSGLKHTALEYLQRRRPDASLEELETLFFNMVSGERIHSLFENPGFVSRHDMWRLVTRVETHGSIEGFAKVGDYFQGIFQRLDERVLFTTTNDFVGIGPADAREGDIVCVLSGCRLPIILREQEGDDRRRFYVFVGPSYVDGVMSGEYARDGNEVLFPIE